MPLVNIMINGRAYTVSCDEGEEEHLRELASHVDAKVRELLESVGQVGDARLILMAALLITDEYFETAMRLAQKEKEAGELAATRDRVNETLSSAQIGAVTVLEKAAKRVEDIAARFV